MHTVPHPAFNGAGWVDNVHSLPVLIYNCVKFWLYVLRFLCRSRIRFKNVGSLVAKSLGLGRSTQIH